MTGVSTFLLMTRISKNMSPVHKRHREIWEAIQ